MSYILKENLHRKCDCMPVSAETSPDATTDKYGPWMEIDLNLPLSFGQLNSLMGVKAIRLTRVFYKSFWS